MGEKKTTKVIILRQQNDQMKLMREKVNLFHTFLRNAQMGQQMKTQKLVSKMMMGMAKEMVLHQQNEQMKIYKLIFEKMRGRSQQTTLPQTMKELQIKTVKVVNGKTVTLLRQTISQQAAKASMLLQAVSTGYTSRTIIPTVR